MRDKFRFPEPRSDTGEKENARQQSDKAKEMLDYIREVLSRDSHISESLKPKINKFRKSDEEYTRVLNLYNRLDGKVKGAKMDIETFAQRYYLEKILHAANRRFDTMSSGQYELRLLGIDDAGKGKNHGLDLMVYSHVTGKEREIKTLSGGESFMAALALALGMADTIQANSGSIRLDVMFIDEGFGSLDDSSRNEAVKVLKQMADSSKLIGIISHVSELKQELDNQLIVTKDNDGSHIDWKIS